MMDKVVEVSGMEAALEGLFAELNWPYRYLDEQAVYETVYAGRSGRWFCYAKVEESDTLFLFYSICPLHVPPERGTAVAEFITRINNELIIGNFELDYESGEVLYKTSLALVPDTFQMPLLPPLVWANVLMMERYLPGLRAVIEEERHPLTAVAEVTLGMR